MQWPFDRVLATFVAADPLRLVEASVALHAADDVEQLADVELGAQLVPDRPRVGGRIDQQLIGHQEREITDEDGPPLSESTGLSRPPGGGVPIGENRVGCGIATPAS